MRSLTTELADLNVLLSLHDQNHEYHGVAVEWFTSVSSFATTPATEIGFVRLLTHAKVMRGNPVKPSIAMAMLDALKASAKASFWGDLEGFDRTRFRYAFQGSASVTDLHLLDIAVAHGGRLATIDSKIAAALRPQDRRHLNILI